MNFNNQDRECFVTLSVLFSVIVTPVYSHRVRSLHALERLSQPSSHDDGKPGDDDGKQYTERSEGSLAMGREMLRCAQHDRTGFGR